jgi:hypothetical protein
MYANVQAIVIGARRVNEFDRRLSLFTQEQGRLLVLAVGVGRPRSKLAFAAELGVEAKFRLWMASDSGFARIAGGAVAASFPALKSSWSRMNTAAFFCEWTDRLTALGQPNPDKYELLRRSLAALESQPEDIVRTAFMLQFLALAGYALDEEMLGPLRGAGGEAVEILREYDFAGNVSLPCPLERAALFQERMMKFVAHLIDGPLKTQIQRRSLEIYMQDASSSGKPRAGQ